VVEQINGLLISKG